MNNTILWNKDLISSLEKENILYVVGCRQQRFDLHIRFFFSFYIEFKVIGKIDPSMHFYVNLIHIALMTTNKTPFHQGQHLIG